MPSFAETSARSARITARVCASQAASLDVATVLMGQLERTNKLLEQEKEEKNKLLDRASHQLEQQLEREKQLIDTLTSMQKERVQLVEAYSESTSLVEGLTEKNAELLRLKAAIMDPQGAYRGCARAQGVFSCASNDVWSSAPQARWSTCWSCISAWGLATRASRS